MLLGPNSDDEHEIALFIGENLSRGIVRARDFINQAPVSVRMKIYALLAEIAKAPPKRFTGGGYWEAMHGKLKGWYELRVIGPGRNHHRLFCLLDYEAIGHDKPLLVVICGMSKKNGEKFSAIDYNRVLKAGSQFLADNPRKIE